MWLKSLIFLKSIYKSIITHLYCTSLFLRLFLDLNYIPILSVCFRSNVTGIRPGRRPLFLREPRRALGRRGIPRAPEMRGAAEFAGQVHVEDRRPASGAEPAKAPGRWRSSHNKGQSYPRQWKLRLRGHSRGNWILNREFACQDRHPM